MKKIILTGVVLLLLILLAADFYVNRRSDEKLPIAGITTLSDNTQAATATAYPVTTDESATNSIAQERTISPGYANVKPATRRQHTLRKQRSSKPLFDAPGAYIPADDGGITVIMDKNEPVTAERGNTYLGFTPSQKTANPLSNTRHRVHFGPEIGIMQNCFNGNSSQNMLSLGFHAGVLADIAFTDHIGLQPGLRYSLKGIGIETITTTPNAEKTTADLIRLHYIEVPVNFVVKFGQRENARIMVGAGPYAAYLVQATDNYKTTLITYGNTNPAARTTVTPGPDEMKGYTSVTEGTYNLPIGKSNANTSYTNSTINDGSAMRAIDWGITGFVGVETPGGFFVKAGTSQGIPNIKINPDGHYSGRNCNYFVSLGTLIGYRK